MQSGQNPKKTSLCEASNCKASDKPNAWFPFSRHNRTIRAHYTGTYLNSLLFMEDPATPGIPNLNNVIHVF